MFGRKTQDFNSMAMDRWHELVETLGASEAGRRA